MYFLGRECGIGNGRLSLVYQNAKDLPSRVRHRPSPRYYVKALIAVSLIMLLIQSDMFKALWFMIYPIVVFTHGPVPNDSTFCQVSGFFLALGIEASG
jgi:hypothetical protein